MIKFSYHIAALLRSFSFFHPRLNAHTPPHVSEVAFCPRPDESGLVDIHYTLIDGRDDVCTVNIIISSDNGKTWNITPSRKALLGDVGSHIGPGNKHIIWKSKLDLVDHVDGNFQVRILVDDGGPGGMEWVHLNLSEFTGQMSQFLVTNSQFCTFLNAALSTGDIIVDCNHVKGAGSSVTPKSFIGQVYYNLAGTGWNGFEVNYGGASRIHFSGYSFSVVDDFREHPVTYVSWYGATAFCNYYGYRLPTDREWKAAARYDDTYKYGCGPRINSKIANYRDSKHPHGTTAVGEFGMYGFGLADMAGNVWEWTSSESDHYRILHGGSWLHCDFHCSISLPFFVRAASTLSHIGFRVCR